MTELCVVFCRVPGLRVVMAKLLLQRRTTLVGIHMFPLGSLLAGVTVPSVTSSHLTLSTLDLLKEVIEVRKKPMFLRVFCDHVDLCIGSIDRF